MQIGNAKKLDEERRTLMETFDKVWQASDRYTMRECRAAHLAR